jgi:hypothetical protein
MWCRHERLHIHILVQINYRASQNSHAPLCKPIKPVKKLWNTYVLFEILSTLSSLHNTWLCQCIRTLWMFVIYIGGTQNCGSVHVELNAWLLLWGIWHTELQKVLPLPTAQHLPLCFIQPQSHLQLSTQCEISVRVAEVSSTQPDTQIIINVHFLILGVCILLSVWDQGEGVFLLSKNKLVKMYIWFYTTCFGYMLHVFIIHHMFRPNQHS